MPILRLFSLEGRLLWLSSKVLCSILQLSLSRTLQLGQHILFFFVQTHLPPINFGLLQENWARNFYLFMMLLLPRRGFYSGLEIFLLQFLFLRHIVWNFNEITLNSGVFGHLSGLLFLLMKLLHKGTWIERRLHWISNGSTLSPVVYLLYFFQQFSKLCIILEDTMGTEGCCISVSC